MCIKVLGVTLLLAMSPAALAAQFDFVQPSVSSHSAKLTLAVAVGRESHPPLLISQDICPDAHPRREQASIRAGLGRGVFVEGVVARYSVRPKSCIVDSPPIIPTTGPYTASSRSVEDAIAGYPFTTSDLRIGLETAEGGSWTWRMAAGPMWIWSKAIPGASGSVELAFRVPNTHLEVSAAWTAFWFQIPYTDVVREYMDGTLSGVSVTPGRTTAKPTVISIGLGWSW